MQPWSRVCLRWSRACHRERALAPPSMLPRLFGLGRLEMLLRQGFGFIDMGGVTLFVHFSECEAGKQPKEGDVLTFQYEPRTSRVFRCR